MSLRAVLAATAAAALTGCAGAAGAPGQAPAGPPVSALRIGLLEYRLALSAAAVVAGPVSITVTNAGSAEHDVRLVQAGRTLGATAVLPPGGREVLQVQVVAGAPVELDCTVGGHARAGMVATLDVA